MKLKTWIVLGLVALVCALVLLAWPHVVAHVRAMHSAGAGLHGAHDPH